MRIGRAERVSIFHEYTSGRRMFAPLGGGLSGFVATDAKLRESEIMILLPCTAQDELLVAQVVGAVQDSERMITAENAGSLARMGVEALRAESAASGCGETESGQVASPTLPPTQFVPEAEGMAPEDAEGTCAPLALDPPSRTVFASAHFRRHRPTSPRWNRASSSRTGQKSNTGCPPGTDPTRRKRPVRW